MRRFENRRRHYLNFEYNPDCHPEALKTAVTWLEGLPPISSPNAKEPAWSCTVLHNGKIERALRGSPCHARLQDPPANGPRACVAFPFSTREITKKFEEYIRYDSFISAYILAETKNGIVISADIPAILLQNIAIILRHFIELGDDHFETFNTLVERGIPADIAYPVSFCRANGTQPDWRVRGMWGHRAWQHIFSIAAMKNFITGVFFFPEDRKALFRDFTGMMGGRNLCFPPEQRRSYPAFYTELFDRPDFVAGLKSLRDVPEKEGYKPPNPFIRSNATPSTLGPNDIAYKELYEYAIPYALKEGVFNVEENK